VTRPPESLGGSGRYPLLERVAQASGADRTIRTRGSYDPSGQAFRPLVLESECERSGTKVEMSGARAGREVASTGAAAQENGVAVAHRLEPDAVTRSHV
jgi:hypothetical protein